MASNVNNSLAKQEKQTYGIEGFTGNGELVAYNASTEIASQAEIAKVQGSIVMAKRFPRDELAAIQRIKKACQRPGLAEEAIYSYRRGTKPVTGPSIHLITTIAGMWGNIQYGTREIERRAGESTMEAYAWDVETNTLVTRQFQTRHIRDKSEGGKELESERDIYELTANWGSRRVRACLEQVLPKDVVDIAFNECKKTKASNAAKNPVKQEEITKMLGTFKEFGVSKAMFEKWLGRKLESITRPQFDELKQIYLSIRDGISTAEEFFGEAAQQETEPVVDDAETVDVTPDDEDDPFADYLPEPGSPEADALNRQLDLEAAESEAR